MSETTQQLKTEVQKSIHLLGTLRDEIRVKLHLAGLEAKDRWKVLNAEAEKLTRDVGRASQATVEDVVKRLREFRASLHDA